MEIFLTAIALTLFAGFIFGAWRNAITLCQWLVRKEALDSLSLLPLISGAMGAVALAIFPLYPLSDWRWLPLVLDVGCLPAFCVASALEGWKSGREFWLTRPWLEVRKLQHEETFDFSMVARLYENGQVRILKTNLDPRPYWISKKYWWNASHSGTWSEAENELIFMLGSLKISYQKVNAGQYVWRESNQKNAFDEINLENVG